MKLNSKYTITMFVLVSMPPVYMDFHKHRITDLLAHSNDECVVGVFATKELAVHGISSYAGTSNAGKRALIYEMLPDGDKQKRVKIYEGSFPLCAPKISSNQEPIAHTFQLKLMRERIQKLEEKLESKCAECNLLKIDNSEMTTMINRMKDLIQV
jgi:hypothetical protein